MSIRMLFDGYQRLINFIAVRSELQTAQPGRLPAHPLGRVGPWQEACGMVSRRIGD
jgi:hypothetical protein